MLLLCPAFLCYTEGSSGHVSAEASKASGVGGPETDPSISPFAAMAASPGRFRWHLACKGARALGSIQAHQIVLNE
jgi:hypothetical protein